MKIGRMITKSAVRRSRRTVTRNGRRAATKQVRYAFGIHLPFWFRIGHKSALTVAPVQRVIPSVNRKPAPYVAPFIPPVKKRGVLGTPVRDDERR
jgi:hypothetical protein